jgi:hypothetical protein
MGMPHHRGGGNENPYHIATGRRSIRQIHTLSFPSPLDGLVRRDRELLVRVPSVTGIYLYLVPVGRGPRCHIETFVAKDLKRSAYRCPRLGWDV